MSVVQMHGTQHFLYHTYNHGHNILRLFDILAILSLTASEMKCDY